MHIYEIAHHDDTLMSAITFAAFHHKYKLLLDDSAYLTHLIEVVKIVEKVGRTKDLCTLKSALLHDILNDSHVSKKSLKLLFGKKVAGIVSELTNKKSATVVNKHEDSINKLQLASNEAKLIKLAALSSNLTLIPNWHHSGLEEYLELSKTEALICKPASDDLYRYFAKRFYAIKAVRPQL
jgi:(p)ppGpp synthase/HD superfamily hydrolase